MPRKSQSGFGMGFGGLIKLPARIGLRIVNGIDYEIWIIADQMIAAIYSTENEKRQANASSRE